MPVTKSAKRALRKDRRHALVNARTRRQLKAAVKAMRENSSRQALEEAFSSLDRAAKKSVIHKNKASRLKSRLAKLLPQKPTKRAKSSKKRAS